MTPTTPATENRTDVVVVGAGPTGLMLACERAFAGVRSRVLERRATRPNITRAFAVHARTLELLDARGLVAALVSHARPVARSGRRRVPTSICGSWTPRSR